MSLIRQKHGYTILLYKPSLEEVAFDEIKKGKFDYQLYINYTDKKAFMYSYFYKGDDGKVWQYAISPNAEPFNGPVRD